MEKKVLLFIIFGLAFPISTLAQSEEAFLLSEKDTKVIIGAIQSKISEIGASTEIFDYSAEGQAVLTLLRASSRKLLLDFLPGFVATETIKIALGVASSLQKYSQITIKEILEEIEEKTVEKTVEIGMNWLLGNQIKIASGEMRHKEQNAYLQYVITYKEIARDEAAIVAEFYSTKEIAPLPLKGSWGTFSGALGDTSLDKNIRPFVFRIETKIQRLSLGWVVAPNAQTKITVDFPAKVPKLQLAKELPYPLEEQKIKLLNYWKTAQKLLDLLQSAGSGALKKIESFASSVQTTAKEAFSFIANLIAKGGASLIGPITQRQAQELVTSPALSGLIKETQLKLGLAEDKNENTSSSVENLAKPSFPQTELPQTTQTAENVIHNTLESVQTDDTNPTLNRKDAPEELKKDPAPKEMAQQEQESKERACIIDPNVHQSLNGIILHEIAWMGTTDSVNNEWMQLKNISHKEVRLENWQLVDKDSHIKVIFTQEHKIPAQGFFVLERTDDSSLPNVTAHIIYTGSLNNTNEALYLFDENCILRDKVVANPEWPAGENSSKKPMQRNSDLGWDTSGNSQQTTLTYNSSSGAGASAATGSVQSQAQTPATYPKILISEIQVDGVSSRDEFVELYNPTSEALDLAGWSLKKKTSGGSDSNLVSASAFSGTIGAYEYFLVVPQVNDDDTVNYTGSASPDLYYSGKTYSIAKDNTVFLYDPNGDLADKVGFGEARDPEGSPAPNPSTSNSLARKNEDAVYQDTDNNIQDFEFQIPSPKAINSTPVPTPTPTPSPTPTPTPTPTSTPTSTPTPTPTQTPTPTPTPAPTPTPTPTPTPPPQDTTAPQITVASVEETQTNLFFTLSWTAQDEEEGSGLESVSIQYTATPELETTPFRYQNGETWTDWQQGEIGKLTLDSGATTIFLFAQDGATYTIQIKAKDSAGNESAASSVTTTVVLAKSVVINEIAWAGTQASSSDEWIELFNPTDSQMDLTGWEVRSSDSAGPTITLSGTLFSQEFYLIERTNNEPTTETASLTASFGNGLSNTTCEILYLYNEQDSIIDQTACRNNGDWPAGTASPNYISMERVQAQSAGTQSSNWASNNVITYNGRDFANNILNGTPKRANSVSLSSTTIADLRFTTFSTITLTKLGNPYSAPGGITIPADKTLLIEPGVTLKLDDGMTVQGTLTAIGDAENEIVFKQNRTGSWCGIRFTSTSTNSELAYTRMQNALSSGCNAIEHYVVFVEGSSITMRNSVIEKDGSFQKIYLKNTNSLIDTVTVLGNSSVSYAGIYIHSGSPTVKNSIISDSYEGIHIKSLADNPTIQNNTLANNTYAIKLESSFASFSDNTASNNMYNGIFAEGITTKDSLWQKNSLPYIVNGFVVSSGTTLTLQAGVVVKFVRKPYDNADMMVQGTLFGNGTEADPVILTEIADNTAGGANTYTGPPVNSAWKNIYFDQTSSGSSLEHTVIKFAGDSTAQGALYVYKATIALENVTVQNSLSAGIYSFLGAITGSTITLSDNAYAFHIQTGECPVLQNLTMANNGQTFAPNSLACSF